MRRPRVVTLVAWSGERFPFRARPTDRPPRAAAVPEGAPASYCAARLGEQQGVPRGHVCFELWPLDGLVDGAEPPPSGAGGWLTVRRRDVAGAGLREGWFHLWRWVDPGGRETAYAAPCARPKAMP